MRNELAGDIGLAAGKSQYDAYCKRILANKVILAWILRYYAYRRDRKMYRGRYPDIESKGVSGNDKHA